MATQSTAEMLLETIEKMAQEESDKGNLEKGMKTLTQWIETTENHESRQTRQFYGPYMVRLYSLRARLQYEHSNMGNDRKMVDAALKDMQRAEQFFDYYFYGIGADQKQSYKEYIYNMLCDDARLRRDSFARLGDLVKTIPPSPGGVTPPLQQKKVSPGQILEGPLSRIDPKWVDMLKPFLIGAGLWAVALIIVAFGMGNQSGPAGGFGIILCFAYIFMCLHGWDTFPVGGGGGKQLQLFALIFIAVTFVGLVPIAYWTGRCVLKWAGKI